MNHDSVQGGLVERVLNLTDWNDNTVQNINDEVGMQPQDNQIVLRMLKATNDCDDNQLYFAVTHDSGDNIPDESKTIDLSFTAISESSKSAFRNGISFLCLIALSIVGLTF